MLRSCPLLRSSPSFPGVTQLLGAPTCKATVCRGEHANFNIPSQDLEKRSAGGWDLSNGSHCPFVRATLTDSLRSLDAATMASSLVYIMPCVLLSPTLQGLQDAPHETPPFSFAGYCVGRNLPELGQQHGAVGFVFTKLRMGDVGIWQELPTITTGSGSL